MNADHYVNVALDERAKQVGDSLDATPIAILGEIGGNLDFLVRVVVESVRKEDKRPRAAIVLDTNGGIVELVERMVNVLRHAFDELHFIIPDRAMSAGTILAMSGDAIWMDYFSCLGPIDPQVYREGKFVPALSYLVQFEELVEKSRQGTLSPAEYVLLQKLDLADLHTYQQAKNLSIDLLVEWLSRYKFKDWSVTETRKLPVDEEMKQKRARQIAEELSKHTRWNTHGRPLSMRLLRDQLNVRINDLAERPDLHGAVSQYFFLLNDYAMKMGKPQTVHTIGAYL
jgi:hypothetical protein